MWIRWFYSKPRTRSWLRVERKRWKWMKEVKVNERGECERKRWKWDCDWKKRTRCCLIDFCNTISLIVCCFLFMNLFSNLAISNLPFMPFHNQYNSWHLGVVHSSRFPFHRYVIFIFSVTPISNGEPAIIPFFIKNPYWLIRVWLVSRLGFDTYLFLTKSILFFQVLVSGSILWTTVSKERSIFSPLQIGKLRKFFPPFPTDFLFSREYDSHSIFPVRFFWD